MKTLVVLFTTLSIWILISNYGYAQQTRDWKKASVEQLESSKDKIIEEEKEALAAAVGKINTRLERNEIDEKEAESLKRAAAEKHALNIENRVSIVDNQLALIERNGIDSTQITGTSIIIGLGQDSGNDRIFGVKVGGGSVKKTFKKYDRRTTSGLVFAFGLNNVITKGGSLEDSNFKVGGSRFAELGWSWKTRVFQNTNWLRIKYGLSFQFNGLKPIGNQYYIDTGDQTELQRYPINLKKSKFRIDNLVMPIHFEFGPSKKIEHDDYFRYSTEKEFTFGVGGYTGINLSTRQKLKFKEDGETKKEKLKANYNTNNFIYGLSAYIGRGGTSVYAKYDLNTIFKNNDVDQRNISLGLRLDLD